MSEAILEEPKKAKETEISIISRNYPEKRDHLRRIAPLWGPFYRVNFINENTGYITYSAFIKVKAGVITEEGTCQENSMKQKS